VLPADKENWSLPVELCLVASGGEVLSALLAGRCSSAWALQLQRCSLLLSAASGFR
jgi:hypothetical protein